MCVQMVVSSLLVVTSQIDILYYYREHHIIYVNNNLTITNENVQNMRKKAQKANDKGKV